MSKVTTSICVKYKYADGWHIFQSDEIHGLYVANKDAKTSYDDVGVAIEKLILLNEGMECTVQPETTYEEFILHSKGGSSFQDESKQMPIMSNKRYFVYAS